MSTYYRPERALAQMTLLEAERDAGHLTARQAAEQARAVWAAYERDRDLAVTEADFPGWHTWAGVGGILYARRPGTTPPWVVRAADVDGLREAIHAKETGCSPAAPCAACEGAAAAILAALEEDQ